MNRHSIELLQFDRVFNDMAGLHISQRARDADRDKFLDRTDFYLSEREILSHQTIAHYVVKALLRDKQYGSTPIEDLTHLIDDVCVENSVLSLESLVELTRGFYGLIEALKFARRSRQELLADGISSIELFDSLSNLDNTGEQCLSYIYRYIDPYLGLKENEIPALIEARSKIGNLERDLRETAQTLVREHESMLSGEFATIRDGRVVLPLKTDFKGRVPGFVHSSSQSGSTLFVEPWELADKNNAITVAQAAYHEEVAKILREISGRVRLDLSFWNKLYEMVDSLSFYLARVRFALSHDSVFVEPGLSLNLVGARHLLLGKKAVGIGVSFDESTRFLVLSGPNTGGKTVTLKTIGLLVLMQQSGFALPVKPGSTLPIFDDVLADIGDEQSIDNSLSTFSGHLKRIDECLREAKPASLILFDELGSGTDPDEGGPLAMAIGEQCIKKARLTIITSHFMVLKAFAHATPSASNASMAFDDEGKVPTYSIIQGLPGQSHALEIALGVGFDPSIIGRAQEIKDAKGDPSTDLVAKLAQEYQRYQALTTEAQEAKELAQVATEKAQKLEKEYQTQKRLLAQEFRVSLDDFVKKSRSEIEASIRLMYEKVAHKLGNDALKEPQAELRKAMAGLSEGAASLFGSDEPAVSSGETIELGDWVRLEGTFQEGKVLSFNKKGEAEVEVLGKRMHFKVERLQRIPKKSTPKSNQNPKPVYELGPQTKASFSLDLRGMRGAEAVEKLQIQLDAACIQGLGSFSIIHGKGDGILQKLCHDLLKNSKDVEHFAFARPEDGGSGKTNVQLRR